MTPFLIGIAGPSCSGKSEVARRLARILRAPIVALDHYYRDLRHLPFEQRAKNNFDSPESLDHELIVEHAMRLKRGLALKSRPTIFRSTYGRHPHITSIRPSS